MNDTAASSVPGASLIPSSTDAFTAAHLAILAVLAVLVVVAILYGMRLARRRRSANAEIDTHNAQVEQTLTRADESAPQAERSAAPPAEARPFAAPPEPVPAERPAPATPSATPSATPPVAASGGPVTQLKGLGPKVAARLAELGITDVAHLAALDDEAATRLDAQLGAFSGRMVRDRWIEQARLLAAGDRAGFEAAFGKL